MSTGTFQKPFLKKPLDIKQWVINTLETHDDLIMLIVYDNDDEQNGVIADDDGG